MRRDPPSLEEQTGDVVRQQRMKYLAAEADARWEAKPRVMEDGNAPREGIAPPEEAGAKTQDGEKDPWAKARSRGPSEDWQPTAWNPGVGKKR